MRLTEHATASEITARYPEAGTGSLAAVSYVTLGLAGESSEVLEKELAGDRDGVFLELGDVLWYLNRLHRELDLQVPDQDAEREVALLTAEQMLYPATTLAVAAGRVAEVTKKVLRDGSGQLTPDRRAALTAAVAAAQKSWFAVAHAYQFNPADVAQANVDKLLDRNSRGVLSGSGDHR